MLAENRTVERIVAHRALGRDGLDEVVVTDLLVAERTVRKSDLEVVDRLAQRFEERLLADAVCRRERGEEAVTLAARETRRTVVASVDFGQVLALVIVSRAVEPAHDGVFVAASVEREVGRTLGEVEVREVLGQQSVVGRREVAVILGLVVVTGDQRQVVLLAEGLVVGSVDVGHIVVLVPDDLLVLVGEASFGFGHHLARILRILDIDAAVVVVEVSLRIAEVGLYVEVFVQFERGFERRGDLLRLLVAEALALLHHGAVTVHQVVGRRLGHRGVRHGGPVGIHRHERRQGVQRGFAEVVILVLVTVILVVRLEELGVAGDGQPGFDLGLELHAEVVGLENVRLDAVDALLLVIASADHVGERLGSALDVDVVVPRRAAVVVEVVVPVEVGQIDVLLTAVAPVGDDPRTRRVLGLVVAPLPESLVVGLGVGGVGGVLRGHHKEVGDLGRVVSARLVVGRGRGAGDGEIAVVRHFGLLVVLAALGGDQDDAEGSACAVDGGGRSVLQDRDRLDVVRVDAVGIGLDAVDQHQGAAAVGRGRTADVVGRSGSGLSRRERHVEVGDHALQGAAHVRHGTVFQLLLRHGGHGSREVGLLLHAVSHHDHLVDALLGVGQHHVEERAASDRRFVGVEADERHFEHGFGRKRREGEREAAVHVGRYAPGLPGIGHEDRGADHGRTLLVLDDALHRLALGRGVLDEDDPPVLETARAVGQHLPHHLGHGLAHGRDGHDPLEVEVAVIVEKRVIGQSLYLFQNLFDRDVFLGNANRGGGSLRPSSRGQKKQ